MILNNNVLIQDEPACPRFDKTLFCEGLLSGRGRKEGRCYRGREGKDRIKSRMRGWISARNREPLKTP